MTRVIPFLVTPEWDGARVDHFLAAKLRRATRTRIQHLIADGDITIDGRVPKAHTQVRATNRIDVAIEPLPEPDVPMSFGILYIDDAVLVVDKPALLPMHAGGQFKTRTLVAALASRFSGEALQIAHRLDRETSGCVVVARGVESARVLKRAFARRLVEKTYTAIVHGQPPWSRSEWFTIDLPLARAEQLGETTGLRGRMVIAPCDASPTFAAVTRMKLVAWGQTASLVTCRPETGRQHQIRAHLAALGFPIVGDKLYGHGEAAFARHSDLERHGLATPESTASEFGLARHALHAASIAFPHPTTGKRIEIACPFPLDLAKYFEKNDSQMQMSNAHPNCTAGPPVLQKRRG